MSRLEACDDCLLELRINVIRIHGLSPFLGSLSLSVPPHPVEVSARCRSQVAACRWPPSWDPPDADLATIMGPPRGHHHGTPSEIHESEPNHWYASPKAPSWRCAWLFREVDVVEVKEMLRLWVRGHGYKSIARLTQIDRKTVRRYVEAALRAGMSQAGGEAQITDGVVGEVINHVRPARHPDHGQAWGHLDAHREFIKEKLGAGLTLTKATSLLYRHTGVVVPYRTFHRFCAAELGYRPGRAATVRVDDPEPGSELLCGKPHSSSYVASGNMRRRVRPSVIWAGRSGFVA
jgi:hypothetical protein